ncbi:MAG: DVUA0089 family protein, partial [Acidobacteriota bacterium]|nr:DVUA0089 family protein [Acidobacteriota bacterium]
MPQRIARYRYFLLALMGICAISHANASGFSFSTSFNQDDDQRSFYFTLTSAGRVILQTSSYAAGGFDPSLAVFDSAGNLIASNQDGGCANVAPNPVTGFCWDAYLSLNLPAGTYQAVLTEGANVANGPTLTNAFAYTGQGNFTRGPESTGTGGFWSVTGTQASNSFAVGIQGTTMTVAQVLVSQQTPPSGKVTFPYSYQFAADGGTQPFNWTLLSGNLPPGLTLSGGGLLSGTPTLFGTYSFTLQLADSSSPQMTTTQGFQIVIVPQDLMVTTTSLPTWVVNAPFNVNLTEIGGYPGYTWSLSPRAVTDGLSLSQSGALTGTPAATGTYTIPVQVADSVTTVATASLTLQVNPDLAITSSATLPPGVTGHAYPPFTFTAAGGAARTDTWAVVSGTPPGGTSVTPAGIFQGTPAGKGTYGFTVQAADGVLPAQQAVSVKIYDPLTITTSSLPNGTQSSNYGPVTLTATGGSGGYAWDSPNLPAGLTLSPGGQLAGNPTTGGAFTVTFHITDTAAAQMASADVYLFIGYPPLTITSSGSLGGVAQGASVSRTFSASGGKPPYSWSGSGLPAGLSIDSGSGILSGSAGQPGNFSFTIQVTDANSKSTSIGATLAVVGISTSSLPGASTVSAYSATISAAGGAPPYSFTGSGIPDGLSLSGNGTLSGVPKTAGTYTIAIRATDSAGVTASASLSLTVAAPSTLTVSGAQLSSGIVGSPYSDTLAANGGAAPYTWSIIGGALPDGLTVSGSGTISGTPTSAGTFSFTAQATDSSGGHAAGPESITIDPRPLTISAMPDLPNGIVGSDYFAQIVAPSGGVAPYTFAITSGSLPSGLSMSNGQIGGTPTAPGTASFSITASDSANPPSQAKVSLMIVVKPQAADLLLSTAGLSFTLTSGTSALPTPASVPVRSSSVDQQLTYSVQTTPSVAWLSVAGGGATPGSIAVGLTAAALSLPSSDSVYSTTITVTCTAPSPCAGNSQTISVSLAVSSPPPQLSLTTTLLSFGLTAPVAQTASQTFGIQNTGGGSLGIRSISPSDGWITVSGAPGSVASGPAVNATATVNTTGLTPGFYRSTINVTTSAGSASLPVTLLYAQSNSMSLSPTGTQFTSQQGSGPGKSNGSFTVAVTTGTTVNWTAAAQPGAPWLVLSTAGGTSTSSTPGAVNFSIDSSIASTLSPQAYYGTIRVTSGDVFNSPQDFEVVLNVTPSTDPAKPDPEPAGLLFLSDGTGALPPQSVEVFTSSHASTPYQASASTTSGGNWLSVTPAMGSASSTSPGMSTVTADPAGLAPGVYRGGVSYAMSSAAVRTVNVTLIVESITAPAHLKSLGTTSKADAPTCAPTALVPTETGLASNFAQPASWPTPLAIKLVNDCGIAVVNGNVTATFSNGDPPLPLSATDSSSGIYSGTWTPRRASSQVTITANAAASGYPAATALITGQVNPNNAPVLTPGATLHVFDPLVGAALGPGNIVQIYGQYLAARTATAPSIPLPSDLGGTSVIIGGKQAPIYFVSPGQINAQVPFELAPGKKYQILISANGALTTPDSIQLGDVSPGIAALGGGMIIAQHLDGSLVTSSSPAKPGEYVVFYMAGLGLTDTPVASGAASPGTDLAHPVDPPSLSLNGENVPILFGGLTPGLVGLYQINFQVPGGIPDGDLPLIVTQDGVESNQT